MTTEEKVREDKYIQFPLCLLQLTYLNPNEGLNTILNFGIVHFGMRFEYNITEVARQLMYAYYRNRPLIQESLIIAMDKYAESGELFIDEDCNGFNGTEFDPNQSIEDLLELFELDRDFKTAAIFRYQTAQATNFLNIRIGSMDAIISRYKIAIEYQKDFEQKFGKDVMPGVKPSQIFEFRDSGKDLDLFRAYIGIKSMIGRRNFVSSNKPAVLSRMIGCKNKEAFEYCTSKMNKNYESFLPTVHKYGKRYNMDKMLLTLANRKFIMFLSKEKVSVIYFSKCMEPEALSNLVKATKKNQNLRNRIRVAAASL